MFIKLQVKKREKAENIHAFLSTFCPHFYLSQSLSTFYQ